MDEDGGTAAEVEPDQRRSLGGTEYSWCRAVPGGTGITVVALLLSGDLPLSAIRSALRRLLVYHPILRARLLPSRQSYISISPDPDPHLQILDLPSGSFSFHSLVEIELNRNPWSADLTEPTPVFFATVYVTNGAPRAVALRFHTGFCDRTSAAAAVRELTTEILAEMEEEGGRSGRLEGIVDGVNLGIEDLVPKRDTAKPFWARGKDIVGYALNGLRSSGLGFSDTSAARSTAVVRSCLDEGDTARLLLACSSRGIKLSSALAAALLIATVSSKNLEEDHHESYLMMTLVDSRKFLEPVLHEHNFGFYYSAILNMHTMHAGEDLWELSERCHESFSNALSNKKHLKDMGELNFLMCKAIDNPHLTPSSSLRTALFSVFEDPIVEGEDFLEQKRRAGVEDHIATASIHGVGPSIGVFDVIRGGRLDCNFAYPTPLHSNEQVQGLLDQVMGILVKGSLVELKE